MLTAAKHGNVAAKLSPRSQSPDLNNQCWLKWSPPFNVVFSVCSFSASFTSISNSPTDVNLQIKIWLLLCDDPGPLRSNNPKLWAGKRYLTLSEFNEV